MAKIRKLLHTRFRVNDLEKTVAFYRDVLGLEETGRHKSPRGSELVFMKAPESAEEIELCCYPASGPVHVPPGSHAPRVRGGRSSSFREAAREEGREIVRRTGGIGAGHDFRLY